MQHKIIVTFIILAAILSTGSYAQELPDKKAVLEDMRLANRYFIEKWPDPGANIVTDKVRPSNIWTRATYYEGLMALYGVDPQEEFYEYAVDWGESHSWEPAYGGITRNADNQCCGQTYIELYLMDNQSERIQPIKACIDAMVNSEKSDDWWWIDALQMAMPIFAKLGVIYNDSGYYEKMFDIYNYTKTTHGTSGLYNPDDHLWWRDASFVPPYTTPAGLNCYWSRGNGWVFAALARVLDVMPADAPHRNEYLTTYTEMAEALIALQRYDGFWNPSLVDSNDYGGKETSGTAFFTFGLAWGINDSILDEDLYKPAVIKAWNGMVNDALHTDGFLGYMQGTGKQPSDGQPLSYDKVPNFEDYGLGAFLLAGSEVFKMAPDTADTTTLINPDPSVDELFLKAFPNPFRDFIHISFSLQEVADPVVSLYDIYGKKIFEEKAIADHGRNEYHLTWHGTRPDGIPVPAGMYILQLKAKNFYKNKVICKLK